MKIRLKKLSCIFKKQITDKKEDEIHKIKIKLITSEFAITKVTPFGSVTSVALNGLNSISFA